MKKRFLFYCISSAIIGFALGATLMTRTVVVYQDKLIGQISAPCPPVVVTPAPTPKSKPVAHKKKHVVKPQPKYTVDNKLNSVQSP